MSGRKGREKALYSPSYTPKQPLRILLEKRRELILQIQNDEQFNCARSFRSCLPPCRRKGNDSAMSSIRHLLWLEKGGFQVIGMLDCLIRSGMNCKRRTFGSFAEEEVASCQTQVSSNIDCVLPTRLVFLTFACHFCFSICVQCDTSSLLRLLL